MKVTAYAVMFRGQVLLDRERRGYVYDREIDAQIGMTNYLEEQSSPQMRELLKAELKVEKVTLEC